MSDSLFRDCSNPQRASKIAKGVLAGTLAVLVLCSIVLESWSPSRLGFGRKHLSYAKHSRGVQEEIRGEYPGLVSWLTYVSDASAAEKLGCPLTHTMACFYRFQFAGPEIRMPNSSALVTEDDCSAIHQPIPSDHGRSWCIREGREPAWLRALIPEERCQQYRGPVLLTGKLDSPNPTHQANLHFLGIWKWLHRLGLKPGELSMIVDHDDPNWAPGKFGAGLARALGNLTWLPSLEPGLVQFEQVQFSIPDAKLFPFDLKHYIIDTEVDVAYLELAENVKARVGPPLQEGAQPSDASWRAEVLRGLRNRAEETYSPAAQVNKHPPRVVVARRREADTRVWENAQELADFLVKERGMDAVVVTLGELSFVDQVKLAGSADVLVGITGSDLVNLMFLPVQGSVVEIFPTLEGEEVFIPELGNMAALLGKNHFAYVTTGDVQVDESQSRLLYRTKRISVAVPDLAALVSHAATQAMSGSTLKYHHCSNHAGVVKCAAQSVMHEA